MSNKKETLHCPECDAEEVLADSYAQWDSEKQRWVLFDVYDLCTCNKCGSMFNLSEIVRKPIEEAA